ncbi:unnamed protein product [Clavelina lepadiformis]|uniref:C2H2-type domain-containing protein n=1 Tax=Clavelina lepadiformis TaxID=159417 RepID=A0ABP0F6Y9_CLALP
MEGSSSVDSLQSDYIQAMQDMAKEPSTVKELLCKLCPKEFVGPNRLMEAIIHLKDEHKEIFQKNPCEPSNLNGNELQNGECSSSTVTSTNSPSQEITSMMSIATQTSNTNLRNSLQQDGTSSSTIYPIPGQMNLYFKLTDMLEKPYKCKLCGEHRQNLKTCAVHLMKVHEIPLKQACAENDEGVCKVDRERNTTTARRIRKRTARKSVQERSIEATKTIIQKPLPVKTKNLNTNSLKSKSSFSPTKLINSKRKSEEREKKLRVKISKEKIAQIKKHGKDKQESSEHCDRKNTISPDIFAEPDDYDTAEITENQTDDDNQLLNTNYGSADFPSAEDALKEINFSPISSPDSSPIGVEQVSSTSPDGTSSHLLADSQDEESPWDSMSFNSTKKNSVRASVTGRKCNIPFDNSIPALPKRSNAMLKQLRSTEIPPHKNLSDSSNTTSSKISSRRKTISSQNGDSKHDVISRSASFPSGNSKSLSTSSLPIKKTARKSTRPEKTPLFEQFSPSAEANVFLYSEEDAANDAIFNTFKSADILLQNDEPTQSIHRFSPPPAFMQSTAKKRLNGGRFDNFDEEFMATEEYSEIFSYQTSLNQQRVTHKNTPQSARKSTRKLTSRKSTSL